MNMKKKVFSLVLTLLILSAASVNAQVIIGGDESLEPHTGAILDLSPLGTKKLGVLLPNVELSADAADFVLSDDATDGQKSAACGMIIFNTAANPNGPGLYVWTGTEWKIIASVGN
jgi:hypothetical protein